MSFKKVVGVRKHFPDQQYPLRLGGIGRSLPDTSLHQTQEDTTEELGIDKGGDGFNKVSKVESAYAEHLGCRWSSTCMPSDRRSRPGSTTQGQEIMAFAEQKASISLKDLDHGALRRRNFA
jgi:hypothetical protein